MAEVSEALRKKMLALFKTKRETDSQIAAFRRKLDAKRATQADVSFYSARLGELARDTIREVLTPDELPNETLYFNILMDTVDPLMRSAHALVNRTAAEAQKIIDEANGLGLNAVEAPYPHRRVRDLLFKAGDPAADYESKMRLLDEPIVTLTQAFYDDHVRVNAKERFRAGMAPKIVRRASFKCCDWCASLDGTYDYGDVSNTGNDVFRRHERCRCTVEYVCDGQRQDVWSKKIYAADEDTLSSRDTYHTSTGDTSPDTLQMRSEYGQDQHRNTPDEMQAEYDRLQEEKAVDLTERRKQRLAERRNNAPMDFDSMGRDDLISYAKSSIKTQIDFKGAEESAIRGTIKAVSKFEAAGGEIGSTRIVFGGTRGMYGLFDPKTDTLHLRKNAGFVEQLQKENERALMKLRRVQWIDPSYEGMVSHELGHAFDRRFGEAISKEISADKELLRKAFSISNYAATSPALGSPRASEAVAENIAAYLMGGAKKNKIDSDVLDVLDRYFGLANGGERGIINGGSEPDFYVGVKGKVLAKKYKEWIGDNQMEALLEAVQSDSARTYIRNDFRPTSFIGDGGTAAIREFELATGLKCARNGNDHTQKARELINQINRLLKKNLPESDAKFLEEMKARLEGLI